MHDDMHVIKRASNANRAYPLLFLILFLIALSLASAQSAQLSITNAICNAFNTVKNIIFVLGLTLMIIGGALYAGANLMPSSQKGGFQGYGMSMIVGGVVGVAIAVAAPYILNLVISSSGSSSISVAGSVSTVSLYCEAIVPISTIVQTSGGGSGNQGWPKG